MFVFFVVVISAFNQLQIILSTQELSSDQLTHLLNEVNRIIFDLIHGMDSLDKIAGILAIGTTLIDPF